MPIFSDLKAYLYGLFGSSAADNSARPPTQETPTSPTRLLEDDIDNNSDTILLPDGRKLGYAQYGSPTGRAVFFMHGHPGSRLEGAHLHDLGLKLGARIIAPDRPGIGLSSPQPGRTLLDYPKDVERLADHLKLERYGVLVRASDHSSWAASGGLTMIHGEHREYQAVAHMHSPALLHYPLKSSNVSQSSAALAPCLKSA